MNSQSTKPQSAALSPQSAALSPQSFSSQPLNWLITGGCGFIGTALIKRLVAEGGHNIRILDNLSVGTKKDLATVCNYSDLSPQASSLSFPPSSSLSFPQSSNIQLIKGDILDAPLSMKVAKDIDIIVHLAANTGVGPSVENPRLDMEANVIGTFNMLEAARQNNVKRFIFASSGAPVGECNPPIHEELPCHPVSPYGASKLAGEAYCSAFFRTFDLETVALRFGNVYGPGSGHKNSVVAKFIKQAMNGETLEIYGDGTQTRDFIYIDDLTNAIYKAATLSTQSCPSESCPSESCPSESSALSPQSCSSESSVPSPQSCLLGGEIFQIATNKETTVAEMTEMLAAILTENGITGFQVIHGGKRVGDVQRNFSDTTKADKQLDWKCANTLQEGLAKTVQYFLSASDRNENDNGKN